MITYVRVHRWSDSFYDVFDGDGLPGSGIFLNHWSLDDGHLSTDFLAEIRFLKLSSYQDGRCI